MRVWAASAAVLCLLVPAGQCLCPSEGLEWPAHQAATAATCCASGTEMPENGPAPGPDGCCQHLAAYCNCAPQPEVPEPLATERQPGFETKGQALVGAVAKAELSGNGGTPVPTSTLPHPEPPSRLLHCVQIC